MKILGRNLSSVVRALGRPHRQLLYVSRACRLVRDPLAFLVHYATRTLPASRQVCLRDGTVLHVSDHPSDVTTIFVVFIRREYGAVPTGGVVIDVGANIGMFAIYAARHGAKAVYACEPSPAACATLERNVAANGYGGVVKPLRVFVADKPGGTVAFPKGSSPFNTAVTGDASVASVATPTITLDQLASEERLDRVDLIKMDCEGGEYGIIFDGPTGIWSMTREIKMEYHQGRLDQIARFFRDRGFRITLDVKTKPDQGILWLSRA